MNKTQASKMVEYGSEPLESQGEEEFSQAYVNNGFNGRKAVVTAGYSEKNADEQQAMLRSRPRVMKRIAFLAGFRLRQKDLTIDDFTRKLKEVANFDFKWLYRKADDPKGKWKKGALVPIPDLPDHVSRCLVAVKVTAAGEVIEYRVEPAGKYIDLLGKYLTVIQEALNRTDSMVLQRTWSKQAEDAFERVRKQAEEWDVSRSKVYKPKERVTES